jgi:CheY-like chemotaxis protein
LPHRNDIKTLLIVDDSRVSRMLIRNFVLAKCPQWIITDATNGDEALKIIDHGTPNFCTMDINMPGIIGTDAAEQILSKYPGISIAIFSANIQESHRTRAAALGAKFIAKPVTEKTVAQALDFFEGKP